MKSVWHFQERKMHLLDLESKKDIGRKKYKRKIIVRLSGNKIPYKCTKQSDESKFLFTTVSVEMTAIT